MSSSKIIVAFDFDNKTDALSLVKQLDPELCRLKIGKELFTLYGPDIVKQVQDSGFQVFLDLKFHDIPATVSKACKAAANLGVWMLNVHALGGANMMRAAIEAVQDSAHSPHLIAVTLLTSHNEQELHQLGLTGSVHENVLRLASLAFESGLAGVVCSARETILLRQKISSDFLLVTPGIRPVGVASNDQQRVVTPHDAIINGSSYLVIGRPITQADNPAAALQQIITSLPI